MVKPALYACNKQGKLLLDVGPTVIKNHLGPQDVAFNATVMSYAGTQAVISTAEEKNVVLLTEMDNLVNIYDSCADWEKVEMPCGAYMAGLRLNQKHKDEHTCYNCQKTGHIHANFPDLEKKSKGTSNKKKSDEKWWYNTNLENKATMTCNGKTFHWCARAPGGEEDGLKGMSLKIAHTKRMLLGQRKQQQKMLMDQVC